MKPSNKKSWATFLMALGAFLIAVSPLSTGKYLNILSGLALIVFGFVMVKRK
ncbi:hypothetical protein NHG28_03515 [Aerococcaceae bacterium NML201209]|nr:hypothetical protein [Aerococcaceae bacterium NML201209]MCW6676251.1 hypothetical protein [Aerococcaceae bacterium NML180378]